MRVRAKDLSHAVQGLRAVSTEEEVIFIIVGGGGDVRSDSPATFLNLLLEFVLLDMITRQRRLE